MPYYRTVYEVEVLSDHPHDVDDLAQINYDITDGDCSGTLIRKSSEEVSPERMVELLEVQGSDPDFLVREEGV